MKMGARTPLRCALIGPLLLPLSVVAQNTLTIPTEIARITNPGLTSPAQGSVTVLRFNPQYTIRRESSGSVTEFGFGGLIERSSDTSLSANRELPRASVLWQKTGELSTLELRASLEEESARQTEFVDFGRVTQDSTVRTGLLGGRWARELTAVSSLELAASYRDVAYDTPQLRDFTETLGSAVYAFQPDANVQYTLASRISRLNFDGAGSASLVGLKAGYERDLSESIALTAELGAVNVNRPRRETHAVGALRLAYQGERAGWRLNWSRDVNASGGLSGYERFATFGAEFDYPLTASTSMSLGASRVRSLENGGDTGNSAFARLRSELSRYWALTLGLETRQVTRASGARARSNGVIAGLSYQDPNF